MQRLRLKGGRIDGAGFGRAVRRRVHRRRRGGNAPEKREKKAEGCVWVCVAHGRLLETGRERLRVPQDFLVAGSYARPVGGSGVKVGERVALGGSAAIWSVPGRNAVLKRLRPEHDSAVQRARLRAEGVHLQRLSSPSIVRCLDAGEDTKGPWILLERLPGEDLAMRLLRGPLLETLGEAAQALFDALAALEAAGLAHRDLTADNVRFDAGRTTLFDFGEATRFGQRGAAGAPYGWSPERWRDEPCSAADDRYAVALLLFIAATGEDPHGAHPRDGRDRLRTMRCHGPAPLRAMGWDEAAGLDAFFARALAPRGRRFESAASMRAAWLEAQ